MIGRSREAAADMRHITDQDSGQDEERGVRHMPYAPAFLIDLSQKACNCLDCFLLILAIRVDLDLRGILTG